MTARRFASVVGQGPAIWVSAAVTSPFGLLMPLVHNDCRLWLAAAGFAVCAYGIVVYNVNQVSYRQALTPDRMLGRMNATMRFFVWGALPLGGGLGGVLGATVGVRDALWIAARGRLFAFLFVFFSPARRARELPTAPADVQTV